MRRTLSGQRIASVSGSLQPLVLCVLAMILAASRAWGFEIADLVITTRKDAYTITMSLRVSAPASRVIEVLTDFGYPDPVNPDVTSREIVSVSGKVTRVRTEFQGCVIFFCRNIELIQDVRIEGNEIFADVVPGGRSFESGRLYWRVEDDGRSGSHIDFRASMQHKFFVMPLFGKLLLRKRIRDTLIESAANLEKAASQ